MKKTILFLIGILAINFANATVYYVSSSGNNTTGTSWATAYTSPAAALAGAPVAGDEVWVKQGTYVSETTLNWKTGINFYGGFVGDETSRNQRSTDASLTILEGNNTNRVLNAPQMASATTWSGFTIQKGLSSGGGAGIFMQRNAILDNCIVQNNKDTNWGGAGIYIQGGDVDSIKVINCIIRDNIATSTDTRTDKHGGGGIRIRPDASKAVVRNCTIENNIVDGLAGANSGASGGGIYMAAGTLVNSVIKNNTATNKNATTQVLLYSGKCQGGGVFIMPQTNLNTITIKNCTISGNAANTSIGGGISIDPLWTSAVVTSPVIVSNNLIVNNSAYTNGGGIFTDARAATSTASYTFENCVIANNESSAVAAGGGGVFVNNIADYAGSVSFNHCTVVNNKMLTTNYGGAGIFYNNIKADITNSVFWGNGSVGVLAPYHVRVNTTLTTNKLLNCAFDSRFLESQVSPVGKEANLAGKVIVGLTNTGTSAGVIYPRFESPTNFVGKALTGADATSLAAADWSFRYGSAMQDKGTTLAGVTKDISGRTRPQGSAYDIGAYEKEMKQVTTQQNASALQTQSKSAVIVGNGGTLVIDQDSELSALVIERGGRVSNESGFEISLSDSLIINSDANGTGTYVERNNSTLTTGGVRVNQFLSGQTSGGGGRNWYVSTPIDGASSPSNNITRYYSYVEIGDNPVPSSPVIPGESGFWKGYVPPFNMSKGVGYIAQASAQTTISFSGSSLNNVDVPVTLTITGTHAQSGFNLIGNPFPAYLYIRTAIQSKAELTKTVWYRTRTNPADPVATPPAYKFETLNTASGEGSDIALSGRTVTGYIPPMQAFWVKTSANTSLTLSKAATRHAIIHDSLTTTLLKAPAVTQRLRLKINNLSYWDETLIYFNAGAQDGLDDYDSPKMFENSKSVPEIYTTAGNEKLALNGMNTLNFGTGIPVGLKVGETNSYTISASQVQNFDADTKIMLRDNLLGNEIDLTARESYEFSSEAVTTTDRFTVLFRSASGTTGECCDITNAGMFAYSNNGLILLNCNNVLAENAAVTVFNGLGQLVHKQQLANLTSTLNKHFENGMYLLKVENGGKSVVLRTLVK